MPARNYFAAVALDRAGHRRRDPGWLSATLIAPTTRVLLMRPAQVAVDAEHRLSLIAAGDTLDHTAEGLVFLGLDGDGAALFAVDVDILGGEAEPAGEPEHPAGLPDGHRFVELRGAAARLPADEGHRAAYASAMLTWHRRHRWCGACGSPTVPDWAGHVRRCPGCGAEHFPRTDPVIIVVVTAGRDHCLLGRQRSWATSMWSALAGFVEPGESLEDAVAREVKEEAGVDVTSVQYHSSQPWPFPLSLMNGFHASVGPEPTPVVVDTTELGDARWFSRAELDEGLADGGLTLPPPYSIARNLIDTWLAS